MLLVERLEEVTTSDLQLFLAAAAILVVFAFVYRLLTTLLTRRYSESVWATIVAKTYLPVVVTAVGAAVVIGVTLLDEPGIEFWVRAVVATVVVVLWAYAIVSIANQMLKARGTERIKFAPVIANLLTFIIVVLVIFLLLDIWGVSITPLLASAGILGVVIGFAAQDTISNFAAGISIYFDRTFAVGDFISLSSGERGTVVDISIRSTTILTRDNVTVTVPNAEFNKQRVVNETSPVRPMMIRLDVGVAYGSDLEAVEQALIDAAVTVPHVGDHQAPKVRYRSFSDSSIVAQLQCYIDHPSRRGAAVDGLIREINANFREAGIKIPFPQRELTFFESGNEIRVAREEPTD